MRGPPRGAILKYNAAGRLVGSFGQGMFVFPHGGTVDGDGNLWMTDAGSAAQAPAVGAATITPMALFTSMSAVV